MRGPVLIAMALVLCGTALESQEPFGVIDVGTCESCLTWNDLPGGPPDSPAGISVNDEGELYVLDHGSNSVKVFDVGLNHIRTHVLGIQPSHLTVGSDGTIVVNPGRSVVVIRPDGQSRTVDPPSMERERVVYGCNQIFYYRTDGKIGRIDLEDMSTSVLTRSGPLETCPSISSRVVNGKWYLIGSGAVQTDSPSRLRDYSETGSLGYDYRDSLSSLAREILVQHISLPDDNGNLLLRGGRRSHGWPLPPIAVKLGHFGNVLEIYDLAAIEEPASMLDGYWLTTLAQDGTVYAAFVTTEHLTLYRFE